MTTRVYLMRHGEVDCGSEQRCNGQLDIDITETGLEQMRRLLALLEDKPIAAVYSSDLLRSVRGAEIIAKGLGLNHTPLKALRERGFGSWEGLTAGEIKDRYPDGYTAWRSDLLNFRPPGGEGLLDVQARVLPEYRRLVAAHAGREIALLLHGGVNRIILADALGLPPSNIFRIEQDFGALNIIDHYTDGMAVVKLANG